MPGKHAIQNRYPYSKEQPEAYSAEIGHAESSGRHALTASQLAVAEHNETDQNREALRGIYERAGIAVNVWLGGYGTRIESLAKYHPRRTRVCDVLRDSGFTPLVNDRWRSSHTWPWLPRPSDEKMMKQFQSAGVNEVLTIERGEPSSSGRGLSYTFGRIDRESPKAAERLYHITYETGMYQDLLDRPGNQTRMFMLVPESDAVEIERIAREQPELIREVPDWFMREQAMEKGQERHWEAAMPPYGDWPLELAIRHATQQGPQQSEIISPQEAEAF